MLIKCPECELQVSDKALACPHCGYPMQTPAADKISSRKKPKRRRLPNGFGSITELKQHNLRNPFWARVCVGKTEFGKPILKSLKPQAYFPTYNEAYAALVEYNRNPYDLKDSLTVSELYDKWTDYYFEKLESYSSHRTITSAWAYCSSIYNMRAKDVRARHLKGCMEEGYRIETKGPKKGEKIYPTAGTKSRMKSLFNLMFDYALEYEIVDKNYARTFEVSKDIIKERFLNATGMKTIPILALTVAGDILQQRAAKPNIDQLHSTANAEDFLPRPVELIQKQQLSPIPLRLDPKGCRILRAVKLRLHISAAGEKQHFRLRGIFCDHTATAHNRVAIIQASIRSTRNIYTLHLLSPPRFSHIISYAVSSCKHEKTVA